MIFWQILFNALIAGSLAALVATGFSLIYSTNRFVHFAHGGVITVGAYLLFVFSTSLGWPLLWSIIFSLLGTGITGLVLFYFFYFPLKRKKSSNAILLIASLALMFLIQSILLIIFGASVKSLNVIPVVTGIEILGANVTPLQIIIVIVSVILFVVLWLWLRYSKFGKVTRAVADNPELAEMSGINTIKMQALSFVVGSVLAGVAGILIALEQNMTPYMGTSWAVKGFAASVIGGIGSMPGAILGGYLLGVAENFGIWFLPSGWKEGLNFLVLVLFLLFRPQGIFGVKKGARE